VHGTRLPPCNNICDVGKDGAATFWRLEGWPWYCPLAGLGIAHWLAGWVRGFACVKRLSLVAVV
jgi:hypothetical protein